MATFNFSTMQMTVKIVYYGPGLCGKTTNLQYIYGHTADNSRGEMVSLETKADRTLFFDLLPLEVGTIAGFKTKIQLYTVPGQVFYNTTRKLVLKGVDGIVFVADSQRPMLPSNVESIANLEENLAELGITMNAVPLVLQYNKRDLNDVCAVEELERAINERKVPSVEASALVGDGVFETLRAISRQTLGALKKQLEEGPQPGASPTAGKGTPVKQPDLPPVARSPVSKSASLSTSQIPVAAHQAAPAPTFQERAAAAAIAQPAGPGVKSKPPVNNNRGPAPTNGRRETTRDLLLQLDQFDLNRARRVSLHLRVEDESEQLVHEVRDWEVDLGDLASAREMLLHLNIVLDSND